MFVLRPRKQVDVKSFLREIRHNSTIFSFSHPKVNINGPLFVQLKFSTSMQTDVIQQCGWKCWNKAKRERKLTQSATFDNSDYLPKVFLCLDVKRLKGIFWIVSTLIVEIFCSLPQKIVRFLWYLFFLSEKEKKIRTYSFAKSHE